MFFRVFSSYSKFSGTFAHSDIVFGPVKNARKSYFFVLVGIVSSGSFIAVFRKMAPRPPFKKIGNRREEC